ncbi:hypothetical protein D9758_015939 [Tetrapyrgos nigripes]|uniref:Uncharacterized protein n=1 Tax=Tetrapyrgos nigripes TaxID=182062 RepID=A0A8H5C7I4_9AGAR|nr:hypothetical protein D9758_015939 [Tetrapyrgos nigripes]
MFSFNKLVTFTTILAASSAAFATPANVKKRAALDVFAPPITAPVEGDVWVVGQQRNVTWDTSNAPTQITNPIGQIILRKGEETTNILLASCFNILIGSIEVTVPEVVDGDDYALVLFGDSGNFSPDFTITSSA